MKIWFLAGILLLTGASFQSFSEQRCSLLAGDLGTYRNPWEIPVEELVVI